jgi:hypothetical protein
MDTATTLSANNRGKKILLVDDDQALRTVLAEQLDLYDGFTTIQVGISACPTWMAVSFAS